MIIEDLDDFMKRNGIDTKTEERSSKEKLNHLQGIMPSPMDHKYMFEKPSGSEGTQNSKSRRITSNDFDFDFPKRQKLKS